MMEAELRHRWIHLYELAAKVWALAPWQFIEEDDVFAIEPAGNDSCIVSMMGSLGEHRAVVVYPGARNIENFWHLQEAEGWEGIDTLLETEYLHLAFESRVHLTEAEREHLESLGIRPTHPKGWPIARRYRPGYLAALVSEHELMLLTCALEQALLVAPRVREDPTLLQPRADDDYLIRFGESTSPQSWGERQGDLSFGENPLEIEVRVSEALVKELHERPKSGGPVELHVYLEPSMAIDGEGDGIDEPYYPYVVMLTDARRGLILGTEVVPPIPDHLSAWSVVPTVILEEIAKLPELPYIVRVVSSRIVDLLQDVFAEIGIGLREVEELPALEEARTALRESMIGVHSGPRRGRAQDGGGRRSTKKKRR